ncbi:hypothetical protein SVAN01_03790 [Stagonosporopsis vannaccii]|nr:hypothetical protein SVAN01_03790 [Stagonosporopsis vannaccii]
MNDANELMVQAASVGVDGLASFNGATSISPGSWLNSQSKLEILHELRLVALGNAKILYGSEKFKFYDVVVACCEPEAKFAAILVCTYNEATKILRKAVAECPLAAARAIVHGLHVDTGLLLCKYDAGDQLFGQQGGTQRGGEFGLYNGKRAVNDPNRDQDDTSSLVWGNFQAPTGSRADRYSSKRARCDTGKGDYSDRHAGSRESDGTLNYDD